MLNIGYADSASIFETNLVADISGGGIDVTVTTGRSGGASTGEIAPAPSNPSTGYGINLITLVLIGLLIWLAVK